MKGQLYNPTFRAQICDLHPVLAIHKQEYDLIQTLQKDGLVSSFKRLIERELRIAGTIVLKSF
jgi:hypothetical protein